MWGGRNNTIRISNVNIPDDGIIDIGLVGDNNIIIINGVHISNYLRITMGAELTKNYKPIVNSRLCIGSGTSIESMRYLTANSNSHCEIGRNCMIANDVTIYNTDAHPIMDFNTGKVVNFVKGISIGNHVWVGEKVTILKNSSIPNDSIVGYGSILSGTFSDEHGIYAGNPAKLLKKGYTWNASGVECGYVDNIH